MAENVKLENKLKFDWQEFIPLIGFGKCVAVNFDYAEKRNFKGLGGQFKKHLDQYKANELIPSIPTNMLLYSLYQSVSCELFYYLIK